MERINQIDCFKDDAKSNCYDKKKIKKPKVMKDDLFDTKKINKIISLDELINVTSEFC